MPVSPSPDPLDLDMDVTEPGEGGKVVKVTNLQVRTRPASVSPHITKVLEQLRIARLIHVATLWIVKSSDASALYLRHNRVAQPIVL